MLGKKKKKRGEEKKKCNKKKKKLANMGFYKKLRMRLSGLPAGETLEQQKLSSSQWFLGENLKKIGGEPEIFEFELVECVWCQTNSQWESNHNIQQIRKEQGNRDIAFCVYKTLTSKSVNISLFPNPSRHANDPPNHKSRIIHLLERQMLIIKFIMQREPTGKLKSTHIHLSLNDMNIFLTQNDYFELHYFLASLFHAQSLQKSTGEHS
ncbi:hypothetical protein RFI_23593, partial [Reticulomyxa filosa]